ncbi:MAG: hypothetical protein ACT4NU_07435 [Chromatiales bacterium]
MEVTMKDARRFTVHSTPEADAMKNMLCKPFVAATVIAFAALSWGCAGSSAGPSQGTAGRTVEQVDIAKFEQAQHRRDCRVEARGKYTEHRCEYK